MTARRHLHSVPSSPPADDLETVVDALVTRVDEFDAWLDAELERGRAWIAEMREAAGK